MNATQKAKELFDKHNERVYPMTENLPKFLVIHLCIITVKEIISAIQTTTGHCELRTLDLHEVHSDLKFWKSVIVKLEKL